MSIRSLLILQEGPGRPSASWTLESTALTIGRSDSCDVVLVDREVSRRHASIRHEGDHWVLFDLESRNGIRLNGNAIERATRLRDGDTIEIPPNYRFVFLDGDATAWTEAGHTLRLRVDTENRRVVLNGRPIDPPLTVPQYLLIELLASEPGRVFTREEICARCYPAFTDGVSDLAIEGLVRRLRKRLAEVAPGTPIVSHKRGYGYQLLI